MIRTFRLKSAVVPLTALVAVLTVACDKSQAQQVKPFKISGVGVGPNGLPLPGQDPRPHWIVGKASYLGLHHGQGTEKTETADFHADGSITGKFGSGQPFVFVGANGDILSCNYGRNASGDATGTYKLFPLGTPGLGEWYVAFFIADFVPLGDQSTGQFQGVSGSWVMYAVSGPFQLGSSDPFFYSWHGQGSLTFKRRN